jgi:hypothetical protein
MRAKRKRWRPPSCVEHVRCVVRRRAMRRTCCGSRACGARGRHGGRGRAQGDARRPCCDVSIGRAIWLGPCDVDRVCHAIKDVSHAQSRPKQCESRRFGEASASDWTTLTSWDDIREQGTTERGTRLPPQDYIRAASTGDDAQHRQGATQGRRDTQGETERPRPHTKPRFGTRNALSPDIGHMMAVVSTVRGQQCVTRARRRQDGRARPNQ